MQVDDRISDSEAACLQSLSDSVAAVETAEIKIGDSVAIYGQGSMGLECLQIARTSGAGLIVTVDVREEACRVSRELGADVALNARDVDPVAAIRELTGGNGADIVFECAAGARSRALRERGHCGRRSNRFAPAASSSAYRGSGLRWSLTSTFCASGACVFCFRISARWAISNTRSGSLLRGACG